MGSSNSEESQFLICKVRRMLSARCSPSSSILRQLTYQATHYQDPQLAPVNLVTSVRRAYQRWPHQAICGPSSRRKGASVLKPCRQLFPTLKREGYWASVDARFLSRGLPDFTALQPVRRRGARAASGEQPPGSSLRGAASAARDLASRLPQEAAVPTRHSKKLPQVTAGFGASSALPAASRRLPAHPPEGIICLQDQKRALPEQANWTGRRRPFSKPRQFAAAGLLVTQTGRGNGLGRGDRRAMEFCARCARGLCQSSDAADYDSQKALRPCAPQAEPGRRREERAPRAGVRSGGRSRLQVTWEEWRGLLSYLQPRRRCEKSLMGSPHVGLTSLCLSSQAFAAVFVLGGHVLGPYRHLSDLVLKKRKNRN
ncbi:uncharacterized protein LOC144367392 [Ictidomys tridecemlineatus]